MPDAALPDNAIQPESPQAWRAWLERHHGRAQGVWLVSWRQASGRRAMTYDESVEIALCFGWIDSKPRSLDAGRSMLWFAPRKGGSGWSRKNKERMQRLQAAGLLHDAGLRRMQESQADGSWNALDAVEDLEIAPDLAAALDALPPARSHFDAFPRSVKRAILEWIAAAKRPETRARRVQETAEQARINVRANQWRQPGAAAKPD